MSGPDYRAWLNQLAALVDGDDVWMLLAQMEPPLDALARDRLYDRLVDVLRGHKFKKPAEVAKNWVNGLYCGWSSPPEEGESAREPVTEPPDLASEENILDRLITDIGAIGHAGEERMCKIVYLAVTSRLLDDIVSVAGKGPSAAGKSATVKRVLAFFPAEAWVVLTAVSEKYIVYDKRPLQHRMLVVYEATGMSGEVASGLIRSLLSEGHLKYGVTIWPSKGEPYTIDVERRGADGSGHDDHADQLARGERDAVAVAAGGRHARADQAGDEGAGQGEGAAERQGDAGLRGVAPVAVLARGR